MKRRLLLIGALSAFALVAIGGTIGWAATAGTGAVIHHGTPGTKMHDPVRMREHMQTVHSSLSKAQIDRLVTDCQKAAGSMTDGMMGGDGMMGAGGHTGHHAGGTHTGGMHGGGMMG